MSKRIQEVDGLRAIALIAVLLFHSKTIKFAQGGFLGVDVFFVISGYVISLSLLRQIKANKFSYREFVIRRILRLLPALLFTILASNLFCMFFFTAQNRRRAANLSLSSFLSVSNLHLWSQSNYFDVNSLLKPYLHTWSLSVEWQFYLTWAFISRISYSYFSSKRTRLMFLRALASLALISTEIVRRTYPSGAFYFFWFRYTEFMCGAIVAWSQFQEDDQEGIEKIPTDEEIASNNIFSIVSGIVLLFNFASFSDKYPFPGLTALPTCLATSVIIMKANGTHFGRILVHPAVQLLGSISYSVYLVHWPILVFLDYLMYGNSTAVQRFLGIILSCFLGYVLYHGVEKQFLESRKENNPFTRRRKLIILGISASIFIVQVGLMNTSLLPIGPSSHVRRKEKMASIIQQTWEHAAGRGDEVRPKCRSIGRHDNLRHFETCNPPSPAEILLVGDSHALDLWYSFNQTFPNVTTIELAGTGCGLNRQHEKGSGCGTIFSKYPELLKDRINRIRAVIIVSKWHSVRLESLWSSLLKKTVDYFKQNSSAKIFVLGPRPWFKPHPREVFELSKAPTIEERVLETNKYMIFENNSAANLYQFTKETNITYISIPMLMCNASRVAPTVDEIYCPTLSDDGSSFIYVDKSHYNKLGGLKLTNFLKPHLDPLLQ